MYLRYFLATIYKKIFSIVFLLIFGKDWFAKHKQYSKFDLVRHLFEIWFLGFCIRRIGKTVQLKLPGGGLNAVQLLDVDVGIITREIYIEEVYDRFYSMRNDDVVIDIGAHVGLFSLKVAKKVKLVVAVEPHPLNYRFLTMNIDLNKLENVIPVKLALSNYLGKAKLYVSKGSAGHTLKGQYFKLFKPEPGKTLEVEVKTLDQLIDELGLNKITFIKIDVEGAELDVLKGSERVLTENDGLFLAIAAYHYSEEVFEVAKYLQMKGFKVLSNGAYIYAFKSHVCSRTLFKC